MQYYIHTDSLIIIIIAAQIGLCFWIHPDIYLWVYTSLSRMHDLMLLWIHLPQPMPKDNEDTVLGSLQCPPSSQGHGSVLGLRLHNAKCENYYELPTRLSKLFHTCANVMVPLWMFWDDMYQLASTVQEGVLIDTLQWMTLSLESSLTHDCL